MKHFGLIVGMPLVALLVLPFVAASSYTPQFRMTLEQRHDFFSAVGLSFGTSLVSLAIIVLFGTPLGWWLSRGHSYLRTFIGGLVELPIILPPAALGVGLLVVLGRNAPIGAWFASFGWDLAFSTTAVVIAQTVVAAPFYVQAANSAFRRVSEDHLLVARTLGHSPARAVVQVAVRIALSGLVGGASIAWARALGEFGATLIFAGNLPGISRTLPVAVYSALEVNLNLAWFYAFAFATMAFMWLLAVKLLTHRGQR